MHVGSQSCPKRMTTTRSSSDRMAWSTCHPLCKCGSMYDILAAGWRACGTTGMMALELTASPLPGPPSEHRAPAPRPPRPAQPEPSAPRGRPSLTDTTGAAAAARAGTGRAGTAAAALPARRGAARPRFPTGAEPARDRRVPARRWAAEPCRGDRRCRLARGGGNRGGQSPDPRLPAAERSDVSTFPVPPWDLL